jgi:predicted transcriptional regulator
LGKRTTGAEIEQIKILVSDGLTNREIAEKLGRTESAIRNIKFREGLKASTQNQLPSLIQKKTQLSQEITQLTQRYNLLSAKIAGLQVRKEQLSKAIQQDEVTLGVQIQKSLVEFKQKKPELFYISGEEQLVKLASTLIELIIS